MDSNFWIWKTPEYEEEERNEVQFVYIRIHHIFNVLKAERRLTVLVRTGRRWNQEGSVTNLGNLDLRLSWWLLDPFEQMLRLWPDGVFSSLGIQSAESDLVHTITFSSSPTDRFLDTELDVLNLESRLGDLDRWLDIDSPDPRWEWRYIDERSRRWSRRLIIVFIILHMKRSWYFDTMEQKQTTTERLRSLRSESNLLFFWWMGMNDRSVLVSFLSSLLPFLLFFLLSSCYLWNLRFLQEGIILSLFVFISCFLPFICSNVSYSSFSSSVFFFLLLLLPLLSVHFWWELVRQGRSSKNRHFVKYSWKIRLEGHLVLELIKKVWESLVWIFFKTSKSTRGLLSKTSKSTRRLRESKITRVEDYESWGLRELEFLSRYFLSSISVFHPFLSLFLFIQLFSSLVSITTTWWRELNLLKRTWSVFFFPSFSFFFSLFSFLFFLHNFSFLTFFLAEFVTLCHSVQNLNFFYSKFWILVSNLRTRIEKSKTMSDDGMILMKTLRK